MTTKYSSISDQRKAKQDKLTDVASLENINKHAAIDRVPKDLSSGLALNKVSDSHFNPKVQTVKTLKQFNTSDFKYDYEETPKQNNF